MNAIQKVIKRQEKVSYRSLQNDHTIINKLLNTPDHNKIIESNSQTIRKRLYEPMQTLNMFVKQVLHADSSCQNIVNQVAINNNADRSISTGAYCKARQRLHENVIRDIARNIKQNTHENIKQNWQHRGQNVYLVDGTTLTMADTDENQDVYPQIAAQAKGIGFPICRVVGIISLSTGMLIDAQISSYSGKGSSEQRLLRDMLFNFKSGDIVLADALYSTYFLIEYMISNNIDIVFVQHGARTLKTNFQTGTSIGKEDHIITIDKPKQKPDWMDQKFYDSKPNTITIREFKAAGKILITTMLNSKESSKKELLNLYKQRWNIEVDFRNIKSTMGLRMLKCKTPQMIRKEIWVHFLAYNLVRAIMLASALYCHTLPRLLSFKHSLQLLLNFTLYDQDIEMILLLIASKSIGNRSGRVEPRFLKRRSNAYPLLMQPRHVMKKEILKNGHPKKLK